MCFNSRTLGRVRQYNVDYSIPSGQFQFTHPGKGATGDSESVTRKKNESIPAPGEGCGGPPPIHLFQFTHPGKGATIEVGKLSQTLGNLFQFTHPGKGATTSSAQR